MEKFRFTKRDRILKRSDFIALSKIGKKIGDKHFLVLFHPNQYGRPRIGITVTKKIGNAVTRNRIKRTVREFFRLNRHKISGHWDIQVIAKNSAADLDTDAAYLSLQSVFDRLFGKSENQ